MRKTNLFLVVMLFAFLCIPVSSMASPDFQPSNSGGHQLQSGQSTPISPYPEDWSITLKQRGELLFELSSTIGDKDENSPFAHLFKHLVFIECLDFSQVDFERMATMEHADILIDLGHKVIGGGSCPTSTSQSMNKEIFHFDASTKAQGPHAQFWSELHQGLENSLKAALLGRIQVAGPPTAAMSAGDTVKITLGKTKAALVTAGRTVAKIAGKVFTVVAVWDIANDIYEGDWRSLAETGVAAAVAYFVPGGVFIVAGYYLGTALWEIACEEDCEEEEEENRACCEWLASKQPKITYDDCSICHGENSGLMSTLEIEIRLDEGEEIPEECGNRTIEEVINDCVKFEGPPA